MRYSDQNAEIIVEDVSKSKRELKISRDHIEYPPEDIEVKKWLEDHENSKTFTEEEEYTLANLIVPVIKKLDPEKAGKSDEWKIVSTIYREQDPIGSKSYTNTVHRDLSEDAVQNLIKLENQVYYYNVWIPRNKVESFPLGLIHPDSVDLENEPNGFLGLDNDFTGISFNEKHQWIYKPMMEPGEYILWHSEIVYHAAFPIFGEVSTPRSSLDMRIYFHKP